jgi:hypothetical protein
MTLSARCTSSRGNVIPSALAASRFSASSKSRGDHVEALAAALGEERMQLDLALATRRASGAARS